MVFVLRIFVLITYIFSIILGIIFVTKKGKNIFVSIFLLFLLFSVYLIFFFDSPMCSKIKENTLEQGIVNLITSTSVYDEKIKFNDFENNIEYEMYIYHYDTLDCANNSFNFYTDSDMIDNIKIIGTIKLASTKCFRPRDWRYLGVAEQCYGTIFLLYENYVAEVNYYYSRNNVENLIAAFFPPESIFREYIDLSNIGPIRGSDPDTIRGRFYD